MQERIEIHCHTDASNIRLLDSINSTEGVLDYAVEIGLKGLAITDHDCLSNHVKALKYVKKQKEKEAMPEDFKLILGNEIYLVRNELNAENYQKGERFYHFILLAKDAIGHRQLREISSRAWERSFFKYIHRVPTYYSDLKEIVGNNPGHLIATTACMGSFIGTFAPEIAKTKIIPAEMSAYLDFMVDVFGDDFYLEIQPGTNPEQIVYNKAIYEMHKQRNIETVVTTDAHYTSKAKRPIHKAYLNSQDGEREVDAFYSHTYLMSVNELHGHLHYLPTDYVNGCCENTILIGDKVTEYDLAHKQIVPEIKLDTEKSYGMFNDDVQGYIRKFATSSNPQDQYLLYLIMQGLKEKVPNYGERERLRLEEELRAIWETSIKLDAVVSAYFVTMTKIIDIMWEEAHSFVGTARGSAASFLISYLIGITQVNPLTQPLELPSWRFMHEDRPDMPDIDVDTESSKRERIFTRVKDYFVGIGGDVVNVCTFGTEGSKSAIQSACRGLEGIPPEAAMYLSSLVPIERGFPWTISECYYGDADKGRKYLPQFKNEMDNYPGLLEVILEIEGLISRRGIHAAGVLITNSTFIDHNAIMKSPNGKLTSQWDLHDSEYLGGLKYDFLSIDALDKMRVTFDLLLQHGYIEWQNKGLKATYEKYLGLGAIDLTDSRLWAMIESHTIIDLFQFSTNMAKGALNTIKPTNLLQLTTANSLMRLMPKDMENPIVTYVKNKENGNATWFEEMRRHELNQSEMDILNRHLAPLYGVADTQESIMLLVMDEEVTNFSVLEANVLRKAVGKKDPVTLEKAKKLFYEKGIENNVREAFLKYIWNVQISRQIGYAFNLPHTLAYTYIAMQEANLLLNYPRIFWNTACLVVNSGAVTEDEDFVEEDDKKKKNVSPKYGKIASAIGQMQKRGITISLPDINISEFSFKPLVHTNEILYGLKGIAGVGDDVLRSIIANRPFSGIDDFLEKVKVKKPQMISLIKAGCFDEIESATRVEVMAKYLQMIADRKKRLTLQNVRMLITYDLIPAEFTDEQKLFEFNRYLKTFKTETHYRLDERAMAYFLSIYKAEYVHILEDGLSYLEKKEWDKIYKKDMSPLRDFLKGNEEKLEELNNVLFMETFEKYGGGSLSKWEMDSVGFYHGPHELINVDNDSLGITSFDDMPETPVIDKHFFTRTGKRINLFKLYNVIGTVLDKDKIRHTVTLLDTSGVFIVKCYRSQFSKFDKQVAEQVGDHRKIREKSWFSRGNVLFIQGYRRGDQFVPKSYKNSVYEKPIKKVVDVKDDGGIAIIHERYGEG